MKLKRAIRRKFGNTAPRMAVRAHVPWYWRWLFMVTAVGVGLALAGWMYETGSQFAGYDRIEAHRELTDLKDRASQLLHENGTIQSEAVADRSRLQVEIATQQALATSVKSLQDENARLKEDLAFFRNLMSVDGKVGTVKVYQLKVEHKAFPGEYRYQLLLLQSGQREHDFQGKLQLAVNVLQNGKKVVIPVAGDALVKGQMLNLNFKYYQRVEGSFQVAPESIVKSVDVRVFENGTTSPKITQTFNIS